MTTLPESFVTAGVRSQEAASSALRGWADGVRALTGAQAVLADAPDLYARYLGSVRTILAGQRQLAETLVSTAQATQTLTDQATRAAEGMLDSMHAAATGVARVMKATNEQTNALTQLTTPGLN